jgi:hypothetical protein
MDLPDENEKERRWLSKVGYQCLAYRHPSLLHWCGYVGLPEGHASHGKGYDDIDANVHGGLTYARSHAPYCEPDGCWWIGFDCAHAGDLTPGVGRLTGRESAFEGDQYRDINYVVAECESLASQMANA